jgi:predicted amidophosphoribosyltransferase
MRTIRGLALGTYASGANAARETPNSSQMRGLVYAVKDNRDPPNPKQSVQHPLHPADRAVQVDRTNAIEYVTAMLANRVTKLSKFFKADDPRAITLVPVPSSSVTASTIETARFRTLRLCRALAGVGFGNVAVLAVQRKVVKAKTTGNRRTADQIFEGLVRTVTTIPRATIVLVDDNVQSGSSIAALDKLLGASRPTAAFCALWQAPRVDSAQP